MISEKKRTQALSEMKAALGCTANELATRLGVDPSYISHVVAGRRPMSDELVRRWFTKSKGVKNGNQEGR